VLGNGERHRRQIEHLPALEEHALVLGQRVPAGGAVRRHVRDDHVRHGPEGERGAGMVRLAARPLTALLAQAAGPPDWIAAWRLPTVVTVLRPLSLQRGHARLECRIRRFERREPLEEHRHERDDRLGALGVHGEDVLARHGQRHRHSGRRDPPASEKSRHRAAAHPTRRRT